MKVKLIYNPVSDHGASIDCLDYIIDKYQQKGFQVEPYRIGTKVDLDKMLSQIQSEDYREILVAGPEKTKEQVVTGLLKYKLTIPLGLVPMKMTPDYAQYLDLPNNKEKNVAVSAVDNHYFFNVASVGIPIFPLNLSIITQRLLKRKYSFSYFRDSFGQITKGLTDGLQLVRTIPKHNAFSYINKNSLDVNYFENVEKTLDNGYLYLVLSSTGSAAGETIMRVTHKEYSHISLAFDEELKTIVSYNGGGTIYSPGLNHELIEFFNQKTDAKIITYRIKATREQKKIILEEIRKIDEQGSSYNILGLLLPVSFKNNIMVCSQFVYKMLKLANLQYFEKSPEKVKPTDFVELDYERHLEYFNKGFVKDMMNK